MSTPTAPRPRIVFFSYSHDSEEHKRWVLSLSEKLRADGFETRLDRYRTTLGKPWPRWMADQLDEADVVLVVCTETYYRRFRGHEQPGQGKGADFEGSLITQEIYDERGDTDKFVVVLRGPRDARWIPGVLRGRDGPYIPNVGPEPDESYLALRDRLDGAIGVVPGEVKPRAPAKPPNAVDLLSKPPEPSAPPAATRPGDDENNEPPTPPKPARSSQPETVGTTLRGSQRMQWGAATLLVALLGVGAVLWWLRARATGSEQATEEQATAERKPELPPTLRSARTLDDACQFEAAWEAYDHFMRESPAGFDGERAHVEQLLKERNVSLAIQGPGSGPTPRVHASCSWQGHDGKPGRCTSTSLPLTSHRAPASVTCTVQRLAWDGFWSDWTPRGGSQRVLNGTSSSIEISAPLPMLWLATTLDEIPSELIPATCPQNQVGSCYSPREPGKITVKKRGCWPKTVTITPGVAVPKLRFEAKPFWNACSQPDARGREAHYYAITTDGKTEYVAKGSEDTCNAAQQVDAQELRRSQVSTCRPCEPSEGT